jgi:hypothetical protein
MSLDLNDLLKDWPHEPGKLNVRKIIGSDGREKLQLRIDLGLIQMEMEGRPDGQKPHGVESLLAYHQVRARNRARRGEVYLLSFEDCSELQQEGIQYYHRYISLFQINDFSGVIRDTQRNLDLLTFVSEHVENEEMAWPQEQFRPYIVMMLTRARAAQALARGELTAAIREIEKGRDIILELYQKVGSSDGAKSSEVEFLDEWLEEIRKKKPMTKLEKLQREMDKAIATEAYERAAELRDAIKAQAQKRRRAKEA